VLSSALLLLAFVAGTTALSLFTYASVRFLAGKGEHDRHRDVASSMVVRIGALQGLILALVFAQEMAAYQRLEAVISAEASAVADIYNDAARYDALELKPLQDALVDYARVVVDDEWAELGRSGQLVGEAWERWDTAYRMVLAIEPETAGQKALHDHMISQLHAISTARDQRARDRSNSNFSLFWLAAISGVVLISGGYYIYPPERHNLVLMGLFNAYTGIVLYLIFAFSNPYLDPAALQPLPFERLLANYSAPS
jgi:hypothetical protein